MAILLELSAHGQLLRPKGLCMKKIEKKDELRPEYDLSKLKNRQTGKYAARYKQGTNLVLLDPDVAKVFPDAGSVNKALRELIGKNEGQFQR